MKTKAYRHGDIAFVAIAEIPKDAKVKKTNVIIELGSGGNPHTFKGGKLYEGSGEFVIGYFEAKNTTLFHKEHGEGKGLKEAKLPDGFYEIRKQVENTHAGMRPVID